MADALHGLTTSVDDRFQFASSQSGPVLVSAGFQPLAAHLFSTRQLEFRAETQSRDYAKVGQFFQVSDADVLRVRQVHGRVVVIVRPGDRWSSTPEADAIVSLDPGRVASVRVADCVPLLIADRRHRAVAAIHAGWRGTAAGVCAAVVDALAAHGVPPVDLEVLVGPSIGPCCYQVDEAVRAAFVSPETDRWFAPDGADRWRLNLASANHDQLVASGVPAAAISLCGRCTHHEPEHWHSFRRDGAAAGRMVAAIQLSKGAEGAGTAPRPVRF